MTLFDITAEDPGGEIRDGWILASSFGEAETIFKKFFTEYELRSITQHTDDDILYLASGEGWA